jgi:hypothetical protein
MKLRPFNWKTNKRLAENQHTFHRVLRKLVRLNGTKPYIRNPKRRRNVVRFYMKRYGLVNTSVESYWRPVGECILIGKAL